MPRNMGGANTVIGPRRTDTTATIAGSRGGGSDIMSLIEEVLRRKLTPQPKPGLARGSAPAAGPVRAPAGEGANEDAALRRAAVREANARASIAEAASKPLPRRNIGGMGVVPGHIADTRFLPQALLPAQGNILGGGGSGVGGSSRVTGAGDAADFERFGRESAVRRKIQGMGYGG